jgi:hypothetical protein
VLPTRQKRWCCGLSEYDDGKLGWELRQKFRDADEDVF